MRWRWLGMGMAAGVLAGLVDTVSTIAHGSGVLSSVWRLHFVGLGAGVLGVFVALAMALFGLVSASLARLGPRAGIRRPTILAATLLALPLIVHDAFALFAGTQARRVTGHVWISLALVLVGGLGVYGVGRGFQALLARTQRSIGVRVAVLAGLALLAWKVDGANRYYLPRLYPWFHLTLAAGSVVAWILFWAVLTHRKSPGRRPAGAWVAVAMVTVLGLAGFETWQLGRSQALRFYAHEKAQVVSFLAPFLPRVGTTRRPSRSPAELAAAVPVKGPRFPGSDVILVTLDAVRADHTSSQGYTRRTTPHLDALAAQGVRFSRTYTQAPHTSFALASLMTGKYYPTLSRLVPNAKHDTLAAILRRYGWKTAAFFPPAVFYIDAQKMQAFEASHFDFEYVKYEYLPAAERIGQIEDFLKAETPGKLFLWLHLFEPHEPYVKHPGFDFGEQDVDRYDSEIAYVDKVLGDLLAVIQRYRPSALVVVSADHGEEFGEHGGRYHGTSLYDEQTHVPLVIARPGLKPGVVEGPAELIDIPTTILGLLDIPAPVRMRGTDLGPWLASPPAPTTALPPAFAEVEDKRMVATRTEKLICSFDKDYCSYFDLAADPGEKRDLADAKPAEAARLRGLLDEWLASQTSFERRGQGLGGVPAEIVGVLEQARLGDSRSAAALAGLLCGELPLPVRREAAKALVELTPPREETRAALLAIRQHPCDELIADYAAVSLFALGDHAQLPAVMALLGKPVLAEHQGLFSLAAIYLGEEGHPESVPLLTGVLKACDKDIVRCKRALAALAKVGAPAATPALLEHLPVVLTRAETVAALDAVADPQSVPALVDLVQSDPYVPVRGAAAAALGKLGGARAIACLETAWRHEVDTQVRARIQAALVALGRRPAGGAGK